MKLGKQNDKLNNKIETIKKKPRNSSIKEYNEWTEDFNRELQQQTSPSTRKNK